MSAVAGTFLVIGGVALLLLVMSLVSGRTHVGRIHLGRVHFGRLRARLHLGRTVRLKNGESSGTELSLPVLAGFLGAFGFGGAIVATIVPGRGGVTVALATGAGLAAAVPAAWLAARLLNAAMTMPTDATLTSNDLLGRTGIVISPVPAGGLGEVRLAVAGQHMKFHARSPVPLALGTQVFVISVPTPTSVLVEPTPSAD